MEPEFVFYESVIFGPLKDINKMLEACVRALARATGISKDSFRIKKEYVGVQTTVSVVIYQSDFIPTASGRDMRMQTFDDYHAFFQGLVTGWQIRNERLK